MQRDPSRNGLRLPIVAPLAIIEPPVPEIIPGAAESAQLPVPYGQRERRRGPPHGCRGSATDPYEVAYLRGGDREVLRLHLFDLVQRGYLEIIENQKWLGTERRLARSRNAPPYEALTGIQQAIVSWFAAPLTAKEIRALHTREPVRSLCERLRAQRSNANGQLASMRELQKAVRVGGFMRLRRPLPRRMGACRNRDGSRGKRSGAHTLPEAVAKRKGTAGGARSDVRRLKDRPRTAKSDVADPALVMAVAVFGTAVLVDSPYDAFAAAAGPDPSWSFSVGLDGGCDGDGDGGCGCGGCD